MRISRQLHDQYTAKLEALLDERDDVQEKRKDLMKALRGEVSSLGDQIRHVRRVLKGIDAPQLEMPGMELGERRRDSILARILEAAKRIRETEDAAAPAEEPAKPEKPVDFTMWDVAESGDLVRCVPGGGEYHIVKVGKTFDLEWHVPKEKIAEVIAGRSFPTATDAQKAAADDWKERSAKKPKKAKPTGLQWLVQDEGAQTAGVAEGAYHLKRALDGNWTAEWSPRKGEKLLVVGNFGLPEKQARAACETHYTTNIAPPPPAEKSEQKGDASPKPEIPPLEWKWSREDVQSAQGKGGVYEVIRDSGPGGGFAAKFTKTGAKKAKLLVAGAPDAAAKDRCTTHYLGLQADALLPAEMSKGGLTGDATKFAKKGRRRG